MLGCLLTACTVVGPSAVRTGRLAYNEVITETSNQQMLMFVIQNRYEEHGSLLAVSSITANVSVTTSAGIQLGFGSEGSYAGNLVPFRAGAIYEENPTIAYIPVAGAQYARQVFSPVPISVLAQMTGSLADPSYVYYALVSSVNGIENPDFQFLPIDGRRFSRFVTIMTTLAQARRLHWIEEPQQIGQFSIVIDHYAPAFEVEVSELLNLLGFDAPPEDSERLVLPVFLALDGQDSGGVGIVTRSVAALVEILSAAIDVPEAEHREGIAASYPPLGLAGRGLKIHRSEARPEHAAVAVQYRGHWFYIDETDQVTKRFFRLMAALWTATISDTAAMDSAAPVLTVPVTR